MVSSREKEKKIRKIKNKLDIMWWIHWKWCGQKKNKKIIKIKKRIK